MSIKRHLIRLRYVTVTNVYDSVHLSEKLESQREAKMSEKVCPFSNGILWAGQHAIHLDFQF